jgi:hypothetical protein
VTDRSWPSGDGLARRTGLESLLPVATFGLVCAGSMWLERLLGLLPDLLAIGSYRAGNPAPLLWKIDRKCERDHPQSLRHDAARLLSGFLERRCETRGFQLREQFRGRERI